MISERSLWKEETRTSILEDCGERPYQTGDKYWSETVRLVNLIPVLIKHINLLHTSLASWKEGWHQLDQENRELKKKLKTYENTRKN